MKQNNDFKKATLIILLFFFTPILWRGAGSVAFAQKHGQALIDSLQKALKNAGEDTDKVNVLNALAWELKSNDHENAILFSTNALHLAEKIKWQTGIAKSYKSLGVISWLKGNYTPALEYLSKALSICDDIEKSETNSKSSIRILKAKVIGNMGLVYSYKGDYNKAIEYDLKAIKYLAAS